jgi:hypothetical protein
VRENGNGKGSHARQDASKRSPASAITPHESLSRTIACAIDHLFEADFVLPSRCRQVRAWGELRLVGEVLLDAINIVAGYTAATPVELAATRCSCSGTFHSLYSFPVRLFRAAGPPRKQYKL